MNRPIDKVYSYDIDGNLFHLDTHILLEELQDDGSWKLIEVPVKEFDHNILYNSPKYKPLDDNWEKAFMNSRDFHENKKHKGIRWYQKDIKTALQAWEFGNSFYRLLFDSFLEARPSSKNTARGHTPDNLKQWDRIVMKKMLTKEWKEYMAEKIQQKYNYGISTVRWNMRKYLDDNMYYPWANIESQKLLWIQDVSSSAVRKTFFQDHYIHYITKFIRKYQDLDPSCPVKMWFSDDGYDNIKEMMRFFIAKKQEDIEPYNNFRYRLYYTGNNLDIVQKNLEEELVSILGKEHSVLVEQKTYNLWEDEKISSQKSLISDVVDLKRTIKNLKIML